MLPLDHSLLLNQIATGVAPREDLGPLLTPDQLDETLREINLMASQASPSPDLWPVAIERAGLSPTFTPCVVLQTKGFRALQPFANAAPDFERIRTAKLLLAIFELADRRRRETQCRGGCTHWWHQDLANPAVSQPSAQAPTDR